MTEFCPICKKVLLETVTYEGINYYCQTRIIFEGKASIPHYVQDFGEPTIWYAPPYKIKVGANGSQIYEVINENLPMARFAQPSFKFLFETSAHFKPDDKKIIQRIKNLIAFS